MPRQADDPPPPYREDRPRRRRPEQGDDALASLIPYRNPKSLVAYYCGVFGLIPILGIALGPVALIFGILGVKYANSNPSAKGTGHAITGIVLGSLTILGHAVILILIAVAAAAR
jgi:hypothetical protein